MGVINLTPNSFSDGNKFLQKDILENQIRSWQKLGHYCFDFGAESTAPMNSSISNIEEQKRLEAGLYPLLKNKILNQKKDIISLDTYRFETVAKVIDEFPSYQFIWNDVSGKWDESVDEFLQKYPQHYYVYSHNPAPARNLTGEHLKHTPDLSPETYFSQIKNHFISAKKQNLTKVIFDPCFGFGKNEQQNWYLWDHLSQLLNEVNHPLWLIGISRKRFLKAKNIDEAMQKKMIIEKMAQLGNDRTFFWRLHALQNYNSF